MRNILTAEGKKEAIDRLANLSEYTAHKWGQMNVTQMLAHMNDAFKLALGMKEAQDKSTIISRNIVFPVAVYILPSWPKGTATAYEMNQASGGTKARDFFTEIEFLKKMIDVFGERDANKLSFHPLFGKLNKVQWSDLLSKHLEHHLTQFGV